MLYHERGEMMKYILKVSLLFFVLFFNNTHITVAQTSNFEFNQSLFNQRVTQMLYEQNYQAQQFKCLVENIYYEAGTESFEGKLAVATVTVNRTKQPQYPADICGVVKQKYKGVCQFSWYCLKEKNKIDAYVWKECEIVAKEVLTGKFLHDKMQKMNALFYHNLTVNPDWAPEKKYIAKLGNHIFYANYTRK